MTIARSLTFFAAWLALHGAANAADLTVVVTDSAGKPVADALRSLLSREPRPEDEERQS